MFRPNQIAQLFVRTGRDKHSREIFADPVPVRIAVVKLENTLQRTTVRADSSASRGAAEEVVVTGKILIDKMATINRDDRLEILGDTYRVIMTHSRFTVWGSLDHFEVDLQAAPQ